MDLSPETLLHNRYRIIKKLGQGGMGAVYLARDLSLESDVAVKVNQTPSEESTTQFLREARLLANLRHPNLPRVIDYFLLEGAQYLVMDFIPGDDLLSKVEREGAQPVELVLRWAEQLGSALKYLHSQNPPVIHRDIKPANIKITPEGQPVLVDFGIAKAANPEQMTAAGAAGYTPGYAPPEQYGTGRTGPYSDQYALAATLYMVLTGQRPVDSVQRVLGKAVLSPAHLLNPKVPAAIDSALQRAMTLRPEDRFSSVEEFLTALADPSYQPTVNLASVQAATRKAAATPRAKPAKTAPWLGIGLGAGIAALAGLLLIGVVAGVFLLRPGGPLNAAAVVTTPTPTATALPPTETPKPPSATPEPNLAPSFTPKPPATSTPTPPPPATNTPEPTQTPLPSYLGNGGLVAFASNRGDPSIFQIWVMRLVVGADGLAQATDLKQLTYDPITKRQPAWSPDGKKLLYVAPGDAGNGLDIWVINADGTEPRNLSKRKGDDTDPAWSPDGQWIAFTNAGRSDGVLRIILMDPSGGSQVLLTGDKNESDPTWRPDMQWLGFVLQASGHKYLNLHNMQGGIDMFLTPTPVAFDRSSIFGRLGEVASPAFSPDGNWVAYTRLDSGRSYIQLADWQTRGGQINRLTDTAQDDLPAWSGDSKFIVFVSKRDGNLELYVMNTAGNFQVNLTNDPAVDTDPAWQPVP